GSATASGAPASGGTAVSAGARVAAAGLADPDEGVRATACGWLADHPVVPYATLAAALTASLRDESIESPLGVIKALAARGEAARRAARPPGRGAARRARRGAATPGPRGAAAGPGDERQDRRCHRRARPLPRDRGADPAAAHRRGAHKPRQLPPARGLSSGA